MNKGSKGKMGSTRKVEEVELTEDQKKMREELLAEFADVELDLTLEEANDLIAEGEKENADKASKKSEAGNTAGGSDSGVYNDPPITPPKDETDFQKFVNKAREIILAKCADATDLERGRYFRHAVGQNLNQVWASVGGQALALEKLKNCTDPVRAEGENPPAKPAAKPEASKTPQPTKNEKVKAPLTIDEIRKKYTMDYVRKNRKTGEVTHSDYLVVAGRVLLMRAQAETKDYGIQTELINLSDSFAVMKATIATPDGTILSTAHAMCTFTAAEFTGGRFLEKAETSAIGRALGLIGLGTEEFVADDDDGFLADSPVEQDKG